MKVFYCCYGSAHTSVVAASIHIGLLPHNRVPHPRELEILPHYDKTESFEVGTPFFMGIDEYGAEVYILGMINQRELIKKAVRSFLKHSGIDDKDVLIEDALKNVNIMTKIGGFISRRLGLVKIGRPLTIWGIQRGYADFTEFVYGVKAKQQEIVRVNKA